MWWKQFDVRMHPRQPSRKLGMRRNREKSVEKYIDVRVSQLQEDLEKCSDDYDKQWYNRIISELHWARAEIKQDCWIQEFRHLETTLED